MRALIALILVFTSHNGFAIEEPAYAVLEKIEGVEIRRYEGYWVAQKLVAGNFGDAGNQAFRPLVSYLSGDNATGEKIQMTAPVQQHSIGERHAVTFVMPRQLASNGLPDPVDETVTLQQVPPQMVAALRYSGGWQEERYRKFEQQLLAHLSATDYVVCGEAVWARYNPPFWPGFLRRNEVLIPVRPNTCDVPSEN